MTWKVILLFALLALAVKTQSADEPVVVAWNSFAQTLGINSTHGLECLNVIGGEVSQIVGAIESTRDIEQILVAVQAILEAAERNVETGCQDLVEDLEALTQGDENVERTVQRNLQRYFAQVVQLVWQVVNDAQHDQAEEVGQKAAEIVQILLGLKVPQTYEHPHVTHVEPLNQTRFVHEFYGALYQTLGIQNANTSALEECASEVQQVGVSLEQLGHKLHRLDYDEKLDAIRDTILDVIEHVRHCKNGVQVWSELFGPVLQALSENPEQFILQVVSNTAANYPEFQNLAEKEQVAIIEGNYTEAGQLEGEVYKIWTAGTNAAPHSAN